MKAEKIGVALERGSTYVLVETEASLPTDIYIPLSRVNSADETEAHFTINVPKDEIGSMGWDSPPVEGSWWASDATGALAIPRQERSDTMRGHVEVDEAKR